MTTTTKRPYHTAGERNGLAKLTDNAVREMRALRELGKPVGEIAADYAVDYATAFRAIRGESWRHVQ